MLWLIFTILLAVVGTGGLLTGISATMPGTKISGYASAGVCVLVWGVLTIALSVHGVGQRKVGIVYNFAGVITGKRDPGIVWTAPWQHIKTANVGIQREDFVLGTDNSAVSKDQQPITANVSCNYQVSPDNIIGLYKTVGPSWKETLLDSRFLQDFKEVTARFTAQEITTKREALRFQTTRRLSAELQQYDIRNVSCFIKNLGYSQAYSQAIEDKNKQVQAALQAQAKVAQATAEADQAIATAKGAATAAVTKARGDAEANRLRSRTLTKQVLTQNAITALNPNVQVIYVPAGSSFLIPQIGQK